jgi:glycine/D-amino acid oxidase-like deaminating enzyme
VRYFPQLAGRRITHAWGGPIDVSPTHLPVIGTMPDGLVHYAFGYTGNGVGLSHLAGRILAALAFDERTEETRLPLVNPPPVRVPPEPLRFVGGSLVRRAFLRKERAEAEGRHTDPLTKAVTEIPKKIGIHLGR